MKVIDVYDIAGDKWYKQPTEDGPGPLTRGCAVVAVASDRSSFNIYYYGGFDGVNFDEPYSDEVWVLSLPSFTWTKVNEGKSLHARAGHRCFKPYDDQMMVFGGDTSRDGSSIKCLDGGPIVTFNLSSAEWMDEYHPDKYDDYAVPTKVSDKIGGDGAGAARSGAVTGGEDVSVTVNQDPVPNVSVSNVLARDTGSLTITKSADPASGTPDCRVRNGAMYV